MIKGKELSIYFVFPVGILYQDNLVDEVKLSIIYECQVIIIEGMEKLKKRQFCQLLGKLILARISN